MFSHENLNSSSLTRFRSMDCMDQYGLYGAFLKFENARQTFLTRILTFEPIF